MNPDLADRFENLEIRREAILKRVKELPPERRTQRPSNKGFSPVEVIMHLAMAEQANVELMRKSPPSTLKGKKTHVTGIYKKVVKSMQRPDRAIRPPASLVPRGDVTLERAERLWENARGETKKYLEMLSSPRDPLVRFGLLFGLASAGDYFVLLEAHMTYHELRFPAV